MAQILQLQVLDYQQSLHMAVALVLQQQLQSMVVHGLETTAVLVAAVAEIKMVMAHQLLAVLVYIQEVHL
jgi:hypothetical protein